MTTSVPATVPPATEQPDAGKAAARPRAGSWHAVVALSLYAAFVGIWLLIGLVVAVAAHSSAMHRWAQAAADGKHGSAWTSFGRGLIAGVAHSYPVSGVVLDYVYSAALVLVAAAAVRLAGRDRTSRFLVIGLMGTAAAFNLQAHTAIDALAAMTGWSSSLFDWLHTVLLHGIGVAAYLAALVVFPTGKLGLINVRGNATRTPITLLAAVLALALGASSTAYPHILGFLIFFGLIAPLCGGAVQRIRLIRPATAEARQQSRILLWALGGTLAAAVLLVGIALGTQALADTPGLPKEVPGIAAGMPGMTGHLPGLEGLGSQTVVFWVFRLLSIAGPCAVLAGLLRQRLWTFELLVNRALTYGVLTAVTGAVYVFGVVRVDAWFGLDSDWLAPPQVAAAGLVALAFHPVRVRLERLADRLLYGRRIAPYDVLAQVSALSNSGSGGPGESALTDLARIVAQGLRTRYAIAYLDLEDGTETRYQWPSEAVRAEDTERTIAVEYRGMPVGRLVIPAQAGRIPATERRALLEHLARAAGVVLHNARLTVDLEHRLRVIEARAAEIRASRWRIVAAQDSERRELERDLHDGAQPGLTAVRLSLGLVSHLVASGSDTASEALLRLRLQIDDATLSLRQTLRGLAPTALGEHGIIRALEELAESLGAEVDFHVDDETRQARFSPQTEAAVYFCCAEAIQNAVKHCPGAAVAATLRWESERSRLLFEIADDGPGFDAAASTGNGIQNMADRIGAAGGVLKIESEPGIGTKVSGSVPTTSGEDEPPALAVSRKSNATP